MFVRGPDCKILWQTNIPKVVGEESSGAGIIAIIMGVMAAHGITTLAMQNPRRDGTNG